MLTKLYSRWYSYGIQLSWFAALLLYLGLQALSTSCPAGPIWTLYPQKQLGHVVAVTPKNIRKLTLNLFLIPGVMTNVTWKCRCWLTSWCNNDRWFSWFCSCTTSFNPAAGCKTDETQFEFLQSQQIFIFSKGPRLILEPTQPPSQWVNLLEHQGTVQACSGKLYLYLIATRDSAFAHKTGNRIS